MGGLCAPARAGKTTTEAHGATLIGVGSENMPGLPGGIARCPIPQSLSSPVFIRVPPWFHGIIPVEPRRTGAAWMEDAIGGQRARNQDSSAPVRRSFLRPGGGAGGGRVEAITDPGSGIEVPAGRPLALRGHAWNGLGDVGAIHVSHDFGATWTKCDLRPSRNTHAWQRWTVELRLPAAGYYEIRTRANDRRGAVQPMVAPGWVEAGRIRRVDGPLVSGRGGCAACRGALAAGSTA